MIDAGDSAKGQCAHENGITYRLRKQSTRCQRIESMHEANYARDWVAVLVSIKTRVYLLRDRYQFHFPEIIPFEIQSSTPVRNMESMTSHFCMSLVARPLSDAQHFAAISLKFQR
jgi:hypothetical protein